MLGFAAVVIAVFIVGTWIANRFWRDDGDAHHLERAAAGAIVGFAIWISVSWILALTHALTRTSLWLLALVIGIAAVAIVIRSVHSLHLPVPRAALLLMPVLLWTLFALWRGAVLPPASHDALSYHLPRAVFIAQAGGFEQFPSPDARLNSYPANYELLLADIMLMSGSDALTEWLSTVVFVVFLLVTGALAQRWWPRAPATASVVLVTATTPILLLHSSAHKNDVMTAMFALAALLWGARWYSQGGRAPMLLVCVSLVLGGGTKPQAAGVMVGLAPFLILRAARAWRARQLTVTSIGTTAVLAVLFFAVGGAAPYVMTLMPATGSAPAGSAPFAWGDLENLWQVPILLWLVPFSPTPNAVWVPWRAEYWFWPHYEIFFSHWGILFSLIVLALPLGVRGSRTDPDIGRRSERFAGGVAALLATAVLLPAEIRPVGFFAAFGRYLLFVVPVVVCWTVPPLVETLHRTRMRLASAAGAATLVVVFALQGINVAINDAFAPLAYVRLASALPGTRTIWFEPNRAGSVVDRFAGPTDTIAVAGAFDTWIHPAFGRDLRRHVVLLPAAANSSDIPVSADWVIVDRSWNAIWGHRELTHMGKFWQYIGRGQPTAEDLQIYRQLLADERFRLVYRNPQTNQAVFWRVGSTQGREPPAWRGPR